MAKIKNSIIISYQQEMSLHAQAELKTADGQAEFTPLDDETALVSTIPDFAKIVKIFAKQPPVFIRHIHPVRVTVTLDGQNDLDAIADAVISLAVCPVSTFSVQTRILLKNTRGYTPFDVNNRVSGLINGTLDIKSPNEVLSITICENKAYIGFSAASDNLSSWAGGRIRFRHEPEQISRAEFKLLEAQDSFDFAITKGNRVLDLGAAPGGWSRIALSQGASVVAVDPALLDESLAGKSGITHVKATAQEYLETVEGEFDFILNDMRMAPEESAALINRFHPYLKQGGMVVLTLKLFGDAPRRQMLKAISTLENYYQILNVRQLFHNRSEVTVILKK